MRVKRRSISHHLCDLLTVIAFCCIACIGGGSVNIKNTALTVNVLLSKAFAKVWISFWQQVIGGSKQKSGPNKA